MKTKTNINGLAKMSLLSLAIILMSAISPAQAVPGNDTEILAAYDRLNALNSTVEESLKYRASMVNEDVETYETQTALERLENLELAVQESIIYKASMVNEDAEAYELAAAMERLENMILASEEAVKFHAPSALENDILRDRIEYVDNRVYTIPVSELAFGLVLTK